MFPTLNYFFEHVFGINLPLPIQTFGFFVAISFFATYWVFKSEFKRYERNKKIKSFKQTIIVGKGATVWDILINFVSGFALGYKIGGILLEFPKFQLNPRHYVLSLEGSWIAGILVGLALALWVYYDEKRKALPQPQKIEKETHPYQLMIRITISVGIAGVIGAKLFDILEHLDIFLSDPLGVLFSSTGFAYYGGLIFGALAYLYIGYRHGMKLVHLTDIGSPGMMLAYGIGRIGCALSGDGDWGKINLAPKPVHWLPDWAWSYTFPHNAIGAGVNITGCDGNYCNQLPYGVYPTSLYEAIVCIGLFLLMWIFRKRIIWRGAMFFLYLILNGSERVLIEIIRINHKYAVLGMALSQAQIIGILMILGGSAGFIYLSTSNKIFHKHTLFL